MLSSHFSEKKNLNEPFLPFYLFNDKVPSFSKILLVTIWLIFDNQNWFGSVAKINLMIKGNVTFWYYEKI